MGQYDKFKKLILPLNIVKNQLTSSISGHGKTITVAGKGNEGIDVGVWFQERLDDESIVINTTNITNLTELITLTGVSAGSTNLGSFTGSIISDNSTILQALQQLETYVESLVLGGGGNGIYGGSGVVPAAVTATLTDTLLFTTTNSSGAFAANVGNLTGSSLLVNLTQGKLRFYDVGSTNEVVVNNTGVNINTLGPDRLLITGLDARYNADYSASFSNRSLIDKQYADNLVQLGSASLGDILVFNGTSWNAVSLITETQSEITGSVVTLAASPLSYTQTTIFRNGVYQIITDDYTRSGNTITFVNSLVSSDKVTATYYI